MLNHLRICVSLWADARNVFDNLLKRLVPAGPRSTIAIQVLILIAVCPLSLRSQGKPDKDYLVYVVSESADKIALIRFGPNGARIDHQIDTGDMPVDIDGPHGIVVSPDRQFYYVSIAHGRPFGLVWKYSTKTTLWLAKRHSVISLPPWTSHPTAIFFLL